ncbi:hypothetical protein Tcan_00785, partial [Toxocara canis]
MYRWTKRCIYGRCAEIRIHSVSCIGKAELEGQTELCCSEDVVNPFLKAVKFHIDRKHISTPMNREFEGDSNYSIRESHHFWNMDKAEIPTVEPATSPIPCVGNPQLLELAVEACSSFILTYCNCFVVFSFAIMLLERASALLVLPLACGRVH